MRQVHYVVCPLTFQLMLVLTESTHGEMNRRSWPEWSVYQSADSHPSKY